MTVKEIIKQVVINPLLVRDNHIKLYQEVAIKYAKDCLQRAYKNIGSYDAKKEIVKVMEQISKENKNG